MHLVRKWPYTVAVSVSVLVGIASIIGSQVLGIPLKDPEGFLGPAYVRLPLLGLLLSGVGVLIAATRRRGWRRIPRGVSEVIKHEWTLRRTLYIMTGLVTFYVSYVAYRNLKNVLPLYRDDTLYDRGLLQTDRWFFAGHDPATVLHAVLGTDITAMLLSFVYLSYMPLVPISLGVFLVLSRDVRVGAWYATTLCLNWVFGVVSYYVIPAVGPVYSRPDLYVDLPGTGVSSLQQALLDNRLEFLTSPLTSDAIHGVAAFASLHVSVTFAAALFLQRTTRNSIARTAAWTFFALTSVATLYFGWHYVLDNVAGMLIGWGSLVIGAWATGCTKEHLRKMREEPELDLPQEKELASMTGRAV
ncbi:phosphatase PAP2 family protein [Janibacter cremeus]|uniref:Membrane-associated phospholipid phosphatase n=1 Tax=Janibacter cremeus TaxID=1285192 RepID=A0A852VU04_9MICO|nr:phosphatase PAP2 family protein [Janibacter cremeus]NYF99448.1 membrane-associated phospholipid phosphatase [Janibacter cremeus]